MRALVFLCMLVMLGAFATLAAHYPTVTMGTVLVSMLAATVLAALWFWAREIADILQRR